ncbi:MAG: response regulator [Nitrospinota bacterium]
MQVKSSILIVDDEEVLRQMVSRVLNSMKIVHDSASDGLIALEKMKEKEFDVIIADVRMPNMDGIELLNAVKQEFPNTDVMIMTALTSKYSYVDVVEGGAVDFITKPFSVEELKAKIERIERERNTIEELKEKSVKLEEAYMEILSLKDDEEKICREINYEREFLLHELDHLKEDNQRLQKHAKGLGKK